MTTVATAAPARVLKARQGGARISLAEPAGLAAVASMTAAGLIILSQIANLAIGLTMGPDSVTTAIHTFKNALALVAMYALLLALTGLYATQAKSAGRLGLLGYLVAFLGTLLVAGDWWFESFVVPQIAAQAPQILKSAPSGPLLVGAIGTFGLFALGWVLFGIATLRARVLSRSGAVLMIIGGLVGVLALSSPSPSPAGPRTGPRAARSTPAC